MQSFHYSPPSNPYLNLIYRDSAVIVLNKPSGLLSVPGRLPEHHDSALSRVQRCCPNAAAVHRLDMDTSGLIVFGITKQAIASLCRQFEARRVKKMYLAQVRGSLDEEGSVDAPMRCDWEHRPLQIVDFKLGKKALTCYKTLKHTSQGSLVMLIPHTGRSHQLRVHMQYLGHPILGDRFYADAHTQTLSSTLCLHSCMLEFSHPISGEILSFTSLPPFSAQDHDVIIKELARS